MIMMMINDATSEIVTTDKAINEGAIYKMRRDSSL